MNAKLFAAGLILLFLGWYVKTLTIPWVGVGTWEPIPGFPIYYPTLATWNPLGWLSLPLVFIGAILLVLGLTSRQALRIILIIIASAAVLYFYGFPFNILGG